MSRKAEGDGVKQYIHDDKKRFNNPPVGVVTAETDRRDGKRAPDSNIIVLNANIITLDPKRPRARARAVTNSVR